MEIQPYAPSESKFLIGNFTNGVLKTKCADKIKFGCFNHNINLEDAPIGTTETKSKKKILVGEANGVRYIGHNHGNLTGSAVGSTRYMIGVHDKKTGKMRLYDTELFNMRPEFLDKSEDEDQADKTFIERNDELTSAFGSSKKKKAMASRHKNKLKESILQEVVGTAVDGALKKPDAERLMAPIEVQKSASDIPLYDENAVRAQDVYALTSIIGNAEMENLRVPAQEFINSSKDIIDEWEKQNKYPSYVINHLRVMPINPDARCHRACCLLYLCYMICMFKFSFKDLKQKDPFPSEWDMPGLIKKQLLSMFTITPEGSRQRMMTERLKDKLMSYLLVLCLIIDEFNMPYEPLIKDLRTMDKKLQNFFRALGCNVIKKKISGQTVPMVTLPIPLHFPDMKKKGKDKRKL